MKNYKFLPLIMLSSVAVAETANTTVETPVVEAQPAVVAPAPVSAPVVATPVVSEAATQVAAQQETVLPQLSFEAQQARAAELAKQAENLAQQEQEKRIAAEKLAKAQNRIAQEIGANKLLLTSTVAKVYSDRDFAPMWNDKSAEKIFLKEYAAFVASGISTKSATALRQVLNSDGLARDILLTDAFLDYLYYNKNVGRNANEWLYNLGSYNTKAPDSSHITAWTRAVKAGSAGQYVSNLVPRNHIYQETLERLFSMSPNSSTGGTAKAAKGKNAKGTDKSQASSGGSTSFTKLALNAQRLRLIPSFNNGLFVNIPSYQLYYFRDGKLTLQSKVIVGRDDRRTPVMYSKLSNVVVNPPWHVPASIKNKDLVPKMARDPGYVDRAGYEIFDGKGNKVNPRSINWSAYVGKNNFPYHIRQKAGDDSALGRYKFNMPSSDAIFLHDTPNRGLFGKSDRALSSGCIRVEKSDELATILLKEAGWAESKKQSVLASKKTTSAPIRSDNPVYLYYVTSWVEGGKVHNLPDIYGFDKNLPKVSLDWAKVKNVI
ncbi:L,D-transpeptidase [Pasteurellaceae bacterium LFhippo2]|nr:L,D-transpeptidase [Pasteurellaceae bacterium LFhippo2]